MSTPKLSYIAQLVSRDSPQDAEEAHAFSERERHHLDQEIESVLEDNSAIQGIVNLLYPANLPLDTTFYSRLSNMGHCLGTGEKACEVLGYLWVESLKQVPPENQRVLLNGFPNATAEFFFVLPALPTLVTRLEIPYELVQAWLLAIAPKVMNDLAGGPFFTAVHSYGLKFPHNAVLVLKKYVEEKLEGYRVDLASILLGAVRASKNEGAEDLISFSAVEEFLRHHPNPTYRHAYNRSWLGYFSEGNVGGHILTEALDEMLGWTDKDVEDAFWVMSRCMRHRKDDPNTLQLGLRWFTENISPSIPPFAKASIVSILEDLYANAKGTNPAVTVSDTEALLLSIQPIPAELKHIWRLLQFYLAKRLKDDGEGFETLLKEIANRAPDVLPELIKDESISYLVNRLSSSAPSTFTTNLLLSDNTPERRLGRAFLEKFPIPQLDVDIVRAKGTPKRLEILLLEIARIPFSAKTVSRIYLLLLPCYREAPISLQDEFVQDMTFQALNYPEACLKHWKEVEHPDPLLQKVVSQADDYFTNLKSASECTGRYITFPEWESAFNEWDRRFSNEIKEGAKKASVFYPLMRQINIIYGSEWSIARNTGISPPQPMQTYSEETEIPRLEILDPEGMSIRRLRINSRLLRLIGAHPDSSSVNE